MMNNSNWRGGTNDEQVLRDTSSTLVDRASRDTMLGGNGLDMDPSMCILWCACALGALVTGRPNESVSHDIGMPSGWKPRCKNIIQEKSILMTVSVGMQKIV